MNKEDRIFVYGFGAIVGVVMFLAFYGAYCRHPAEAAAPKVEVKQRGEILEIYRPPYSGFVKAYLLRVDDQEYIIGENGGMIPHKPTIKIEKDSK